MWETVSVFWRIRLKVGYTWNHPTSESQLTIAFDELSRFVDSNEFSASQWPVFARTHWRLCYNSIKMHHSLIHLDSLSLALAFSLPTVWCSIFHRTIQTMRDARMHVQNLTQRPWHTRCTVTRILINIYFTTFSFGFLDSFAMFFLAQNSMTNDLVSDFWLVTMLAMFWKIHHFGAG